MTQTSFSPIKRLFVTLVTLCFCSFSLAATAPPLPPLSPPATRRHSNLRSLLQQQQQQQEQTQQVDTPTTSIPPSPPSPPHLPQTRRAVPTNLLPVCEFNIAYRILDLSPDYTDIQSHFTLKNNREIDAQDWQVVLRYQDYPIVGFKEFSNVLPLSLGSPSGAPARVVDPATNTSIISGNGGVYSFNSTSSLAPLPSSSSSSSSSSTTTTTTTPSSINGNETLLLSRLNFNGLQCALISRGAWDPSSLRFDQCQSSLSFFSSFGISYSGIDQGCRADYCCGAVLRDPLNVPSPPPPRPPPPPPPPPPSPPVKPIITPMPEGEGDIPTGIDGETNGDGQTEEKDSNNNSSSSGPAIGVGVGAALGAAALSIFVAWLLWRRRWKKQQQEGGGKGDDGSFYPPPGVVVGVVGGLSLRHAPAINSHQVVSLQATSTTTTTTTSNGAAGTLVAGGGRAVIMASPLAGPRYGFKRRNDTATSATATGTTGTTSITNTSTSSSSQATTTAADVAQEVILHEQIGQGAFGVVYRGKWSGEDVAVKVLQTACSAQSRELKSFAQEASLLSTLTHPNVIRLIAACTTPPNICIVEELATGGSLYDLLHYSRSSSNDGEDVAAATAEQPSTSTPPPPPKQERRRQRNPLPYGQLLELAVQVADAMSYLHVKARIVHRDLKPQNILLSGKDRSIAKICDLGIAKFKDRTFLSTVNGQAGTPQYMAPELFDGGPVSDKVDIFSFAVVLWEMVTGEVPWSNAPSPMQIIYYIGVLGQRLPIPMACPPELRRIIEACWADVPTSRPSFPQILQWLQDELQRVEMDPELRDRRMPTAAYMQDILEEEEEEEEGGEHYVENNNNNEHMPSGDLEGHHITEEDNKRTSDVESGTVASHGSSPTAVVIENAGGSSSSKASPLYFGHMLHSFEASASEGSMMSTR